MATTPPTLLSKTASNEYSVRFYFDPPHAGSLCGGINLINLQDNSRVELGQVCASGDDVIEIPHEEQDQDRTPCTREEDLPRYARPSDDDCGCATVRRDPGAPLAPLAWLALGLVALRRRQG